MCSSDLGAHGVTILIKDSPRLTSLDGLGVEGALLGSFRVAGCGALRSLEGSHRITALGKDWQAGPPEHGVWASRSGVRLPAAWIPGVSIALQDLPVLESLRGLRGLTGSLPGHLFVWRCLALRSFTGLEGVTGVHGSVHVTESTELISFSGLDNVKYIF